MSGMTIYVPRHPAGPGFAHLIRGSALVGRQWSATHTLVYYEGNLYGAANIKTWADRVRIAAGRLREEYPTVAIMVVPTAELYKVGVINHDLNHMEIDEAGLDRIAGWLLGSEDRDSCPDCGASWRSHTGSYCEECGTPRNLLDRELEFSR